MFRKPEMTNNEWVDMLRYIYPIVERNRYESANNGREYYDYERMVHGSDRQDEFLDPYSWEYFTAEMDDFREDFIQEDAPTHVLDRIVAETVKQVENGGRRQVIKSVQNNNTSVYAEGRTASEIIGWARVATGAETCSWCLMLVSRGPVYQFASSAGLDLDDSSALESYREDNEEYSDLMGQWHPNCDCKVVPVFDRDEWPGKEASDKALDLWIEYTRGYSGREAINAFRRAIERGDVVVPDLAGIPAA